jgi:hypothetical protein
MRRRPRAGLTDKELVALLEQQSPAGTCSSPKTVSCLLDRPANDTTRVLDHAVVDDQAASRRTACRASDGIRNSRSV